MPSAYNLAVTSVNQLKDLTFSPKDYSEVVQAYALIAICEELKDIKEILNERLKG